MDEYELEERLQSVEQHRGKGTELISLYVPPDKNLNALRQRLDQEYAEAGNIKSKRTRKNVQSAVRRTRRLLDNYQEPPDNGLVLFVGSVDGEMVDYVFDDLPKSIEQSKYKCSNSFEVGPLLSYLEPDTAYGLIVVERGGAALGVLAGTDVRNAEEFESNVMGKTRAGGQSAQRFARERQRQKKEFFDKVARRANEKFMDGSLPWVDGIVIGGTTGTVEEFINDTDELHHEMMKRRLNGTFSVEYGNEEGLKNLAEKASSTIDEHEYQEQRDKMEEFFVSLKKDEPVAYGFDEVEKAVLQYQAASDVLISTKLERNKVREIAKKAENTGADVYFISTDFEKGNQLHQAFEGIAAILRYPIN